MTKKDINVLLLYPPNQSWPGSMCKPNGSLAYPSLAGALLERDINVQIYDACVGNEQDDLQQTFYSPVEMENGLFRTGVSDNRILEQVAGFDIIGLTSIFSDQESMVLATARLIKKTFPDKFLVAGGVNARSRMQIFFDNGIDVISLSEGEKAICQIAECFPIYTNSLKDIPAIAFKSIDNNIVINKTRPADIVNDLDLLPMPAWHLLPNHRYWEISRPHGGQFPHGEKIRYGSMVTSLGCTFKCPYCHIGGETPDSLSGPIGQFRVKSDERVVREIDEMIRLGMTHIFIEDDTLFGDKERGIRLLKKIRGENVSIMNVNGINLSHFFCNTRPDAAVLQALSDAGFRDISLAFESGSERMIRKYASNKWDINRYDIKDLLKLCRDYGLTTEGSFMIGYPDETREEINATVEYAKRLVSEGLDRASFLIVLPLPGTPLHEMALREGYLSPDFNIDRMHWTKANLINTAVPPEELEGIRAKAWEEINSTDFLTYKKQMAVDL
jgi:radical SAM superfamily enzyme YgiQ (UPF0313 family)